MSEEHDKETKPMCSESKAKKALGERYEDFKNAFRKDFTSLPPGTSSWRFPDSAVESTTKVVKTALDFLVDHQQVQLSEVGEKQYFAFSDSVGAKMSRCVNKALFDESGALAFKYLAALADGPAKTMGADEITRACYTVAMSYCAANDLLRTRDKKTPGTYFELLVGLLFSIHKRCIPQQQIQSSISTATGVCLRISYLTRAATSRSSMCP